MPARSRSVSVSGVATLTVLAVAAILAAPGCQAPPLPITGVQALNGTYYTRHTFFGTRSDVFTNIYPSNYIGLPVVFPPGEEVKIEMYSDRRLDLRINGLPCRMRAGDFPFPTDPTGVERFLDKHFAKSLPEVGLEKLDQMTLTYINQGKAAKGMTKAEVLMALGYPSHIGVDRLPAEPLDRDKILAANEWIYRVRNIAGLVDTRAYEFNLEGRLEVVIP